MNDGGQVEVPSILSKCRGGSWPDRGRGSLVQEDPAQVWAFFAIIKVQFIYHKINHLKVYHSFSTIMSHIIISI